MRLVWAALCLICLPLAASAQESKPLSLSDAIELALKRQPTLAAAGASREAASERVRQAKARLGPTVSPTFNYQSQAIRGGTVTNIINGIPVTQPANRSIDTRQEELATSIRIFDTGARYLNVRQAQQSLDSSALAELNTRQTVISNVATNYYAVLRNRALVRVSAAQIERAENAVKLVKAQLAAGVAAAKDVLQPEADLANARVNLLQAQNNVQISEAQLRNAMGTPEMGVIELSDVPAPTADTPILAAAVLAGETDDASALAKLIAFAQKNRPDLAQARVNVALSDTGVRQARLATQPQLNVDVLDRQQFDAKNNPLRRSTETQTFALSFSYPLFDGGSVRSQLRASQASKRASEFQLESQLQQVQVEIEQNWRSLQLARASIPAAEAAQKAAQINYDAAIASRKAEVGNITEIITAQTSLVQAQINYVQAIYNFYTADAQLARALGMADRIAEKKP